VAASIIQEDAELVADKSLSNAGGVSGSTVMITGAGGFLGSFLLDVFESYNRIGTEKSCHIIAVDNSDIANSPRHSHLSESQQCTFVRQDITQAFESPRRPDWIIHAASIASPIHYRLNPLSVIDVNVNGTWNILEMARRGVRGLVYLSSSEIYGNPARESVPTREEYWGNVSCTGPRACYDESKRLGETLCATYFRQYAIPVKTVRPFNVYGPGQQLDDRRVIPDFMAAALAKRPIVMYGDGRATRSFCYLSDFARGMFCVLFQGRDGDAYNVGNDEELSIGEIAQIAAHLAGPPTLPVEYQVSEDTDYLTDNPERRCPDLTKLRSETGWTPMIDTRTGLARTLESYRAGLLAEA